ncbi:MAG: aminoglycoside phosphotransferase family protein [Marinilabiliales bacterium]|nr:MAG: aminoglycoside phosphotransferase family protein [Marinilabiliales bacterium]
MLESEIRSVFGNFKTTGTFLSGKPTGSGHIHKTLLVKTKEKDAPDYILQKINQNVFPPVREMMDNIIRVTRHIRTKRAGDSQIGVLEVIETRSGDPFFTDQSGNHWRIYNKLEPGISYDIVPNNKVANEAGKAFGQFIGDLRDMPADEIYPVIPEFHSIEMRFEKFLRAIEANAAGRVDEVKSEIETASRAIDAMLVIPRLEREGKLPVRVTHNDTKLNNILFDEKDRAACVIDLDTVMPGLSLYDFGDTIRTAANTADEDEADLNRIRFSIPVFRAYTNGFIEKTVAFLTQSELELLPLSARYMTFIMGLRFLTDYIMGDIYYSTGYSDQNLRRCRAQFRLMQLIEERHDECMDIVMQAARMHGK